MYWKDRWEKVNDGRGEEMIKTQAEMGIVVLKEKMGGKRKGKGRKEERKRKGRVSAATPPSAI